MDMRESAMNATTLEALLVRLEGLVLKDHDLLNELDQKLGEVLARFAYQERRFEDHERRLRDLEFAKWKITGMAAALSAVVPLVVNYLLKRLG